MLLGRIHSVESMGLVDGPGIRTVVFLQECHLRCQYCHNPDTWAYKGEKTRNLTPEELVKKLIRFKPYYGEDGGVTFSGGEPILQREFLVETLSLCQQAGIHTCLDTAGCGVGGYEEILRYTDLVLFDIKHYTNEGYQKVTGRKIDESLKFLDAMQKMKTPIWIRHVVVPGLTDSKEHLKGLREYIKTLENVQKVELLPYHILGESKYEALGISYPLAGTPPMEMEKIIKWQERMNQDIMEKEGRIAL